MYLVPFHRAERSLATGLLELLHAREDRLAVFQRADWGRVLAWLGSRSGSDLAPEQEQAVRLALTQRVAVRSGGPGCGKSFTVRSIVELAAARPAKIVLAAPTGRAAKRLAAARRGSEIRPGQPAGRLDRSYALTSAGMATAVEALRVRATGPRTFP